jgi:uncharacterized protein YndB with AHSA1/START domain
MKQTIFNINAASDTWMLVEREFDATVEQVWQAGLKKIILINF